MQAVLVLVLVLILVLVLVMILILILASFQVNVSGSMELDGSIIDDSMVCQDYGNDSFEKAEV